MPLLAQKKVYIHMPKTGGSWIAKLIKNDLGGTDVGGHHGHASWDQLRPHEARDKELWGTIRDPWSWYHSWWRHGMRTGLKDAMAVYGGGSTEFKDVLYGVLSKDPNRCPERCAVIWSLPKEEASRWEYLKGDGGLYSWAFSHMYGDRVRTLVDINRMSEGVRELFNISTNNDSHPPVNSVDRVTEDDHYDDEMARKVLEIDQALISHLGYEGPGSSLKTPVLRL